MFITAKAITSVDVTLCNVYNGKRVVHLDGIKRVRLPAPRRLAPELQSAGGPHEPHRLKYQPQVFENGWYCACGAFHPTEEDTVYCSECGCDRILLQNALNTLLQPAAPADEMEMPLTPRLLPQRPLRWRSYPHRGRSPCCSGGSRRRAHPGRGSTGLRAKG